MINICYQHAKAKSVRVLDAFRAGCKEETAPASVEDPQLFAGDVAFYGVRPPWARLWKQAITEKRTWYYVDNAWFDCSRENYFRVGVNAVQSWSKKHSDGKRLARLGVQIAPWRKKGEHVLVCPQTHEFLTTVAQQPNWLQESIAQVKQFTGRKIVVRDKKTRGTLQHDLKGAWIMVCHSSAAAVEALAAGIPVIVCDPRAACATFSTSFNEIESPYMPDGRLEFMGRLADSQWTLDELRKGEAWREFSSWKQCKNLSKIESSESLKPDVGSGAIRSTA